MLIPGVQVGDEERKENWGGMKKLANNSVKPNSIFLEY